MLGVILAGGEGSRLGGGKPHVDLGGKPMITWVIHALQRQVEAVMIAGNAPHLERYSLPVLLDAANMAGPVSGLYAALQAAKSSETDGVLITPCDTPFLPDGLAQALAGDHVCVPSVAGRALWAVSYWPKASIDGALRDIPRLTQHERGTSLRAALQSAGCILMPQNDPDAFLGVNTPDALAMAQARLGEA